MHQGRQSGDEDDAAESCHRFSVERGAPVAQRDRLQFGELVAAFGVAAQDCQLVADEHAAAVGEDRRSAGETRPILLAAAGREPSDAATVRGHGRADRGAALASRVESATGRRKPGGSKQGDGEVSEKSYGNGSRRRLSPSRRRTPGRQMGRWRPERKILRS